MTAQQREHNARLVDVEEALRAGEMWGAVRAVNTYATAYTGGESYPRLQRVATLPWLAASDRDGFVRVARVLVAEIQRLRLPAHRLDDALQAVRSGAVYGPAPVPALRRPPLTEVPPAEHVGLSADAQALTMIWRIAYAVAMITERRTPDGEMLAMLATAAREQAQDARQPL